MRIAGPCGPSPIRRNAMLPCCGALAVSAEGTFPDRDALTGNKGQGTRYGRPGRAAIGYRAGLFAAARLGTIGT